MWSLKSKAKYVVAASSIIFFTSCASTTNLGTTGVQRKQLLLVSSAQMNSMAAKQYAQTVQKARSASKLDQNKRQVLRIRNIANKIINQVDVFRPDAKNWNWEVHTIKSDMLNAYVAPGGKIMFYSGIIDRLELTDDEIAAIMGHEVAHALREHARESASRQMATQMGFGILASSVGLSQSQAKTAAMINQLGFALPHSRRQESEADVLGLELAARAGYNPNAAVTLWQKMMGASKGGGPEFMSTHPSSRNRIRQLQALVPKVLPLYQQSGQRSSKVNYKSNKNRFKRYTGK